MILVTGGAGFIGSNFIFDWLANEDEAVVNVDKLTYAGNLNNLSQLADDPRHVFVQGDIGDSSQLTSLLAMHRPRAIVHFAAETHVDRSIYAPDEFVATNIGGTFCLLEATRAYWNGLPAKERDAFRFLHVSTDEVYGSLDLGDPPFSELTPYAPNSPYAASKAASDHLVRAWQRTYGLPVLTTNCSNNYGPFQFPEKLVPLMIVSALAGRPLLLYGDGKNLRDWLYVCDHCAALRRVLDRGVPGARYNVGGWNEKTNLEVVQELCAVLDRIVPREEGDSYREQIAFVADRPGHDRRYAIDARKIERELGWRPAESFESGLLKTVQWYLANRAWMEELPSDGYRQGAPKYRAQRIGSWK